ncbi:hypothetical protein B0O99DRAFT_681504 [Bisporella sp. PMI_857]|nr:hypothetical protein B0O99DRAFT_681504 [Bisporella sp. PMI_857]
MATAQALKDQMLVEAYNSSIDTSTVLAILSDFDLENPTHREEAHNILKVLKESAEIEDKKTVSDLSDIGSNALKSAGFESRSDSGKSLLWSENTSSTQALSSLDFDQDDQPAHEQNDNAFGKDLDGLDAKDKVRLLADLFPSLKRFSIEWSLKKHKWDMNLAVDDLMTQSFLEDSGERQLGIDAFSETKIIKPKKQRRRKAGKSKAPWNDQDTSSSAVNIWDTGKQDIEFISTRTGTPAMQISSIYHKNGASVPATISHLINSQQALNIESEDPIIHSNTIELTNDFPSIPASSLKALVQITHPSLTYAHELAKALAARPNNGKPLIDIELRHVPLENDLKLGAKRADTKTYSLEEAALLATKYKQERDTAFQKAREAYRKGKSDHLMGGAAAYYAQQGRDADVIARSAQRAMADALAVNQSSKIELDLHGMNVNDAKRITKERVITWWHEIGTNEAGRPTIGSRYHIITGMGHHSNGGISKLGPAIGRMLIRDGWKVEVQPGRLYVTGVVVRK